MIERGRAWLVAGLARAGAGWRSASFTQRALVIVGVAMIGYGGWLLAARMLAGRLDPIRFATWWLGGPLMADLVVIPAIVLVGIGLGRALPGRWRTGVEAATLVSALLLLVAIPVLTGWGRRSDNPTLLDRDYALGLGALVLVVWAVSLVVAVLVPALARTAGSRKPTKSR